MICVGFTGSRWGMTEHQISYLAKSIAGLDIEFHHGDCVGADAEAHALATGLRIPVVLHPPIEPRARAFCSGAIRSYDPAPYMKRDRAIVNCSDFVIATPYEMTEQRQGGTWSTVRIARRLGKKLAVILPDGTVTV